MNRSETSDPSAALNQRLSLPSWLFSLVLHALLFIALSWSLNLVPRGTGAEEARTVGVVLKHTSDTSSEGDYYEDQADAEQASQNASSSPSTSPLDDAVASSPSPALPSARDVLGFGNPEGSQLGGADNLLSGGAGQRTISGGRARTQVFGIPAEGFKFVYVFDRSGSMGGSNRNALNRAKAELMASLQSLGETHQFQIVFYNERPTMFSLAGTPGRLVFGNEPNKRQAHKFIQGIVADGGTEHEPALLAALSLAPDVIFFLTDADQPELSPSQLRKIVERNRRGTVINTIEFGNGPPLGTNFLSRLAQQNGGSYSYVDITVPYTDRNSGTHPRGTP